MTEQHTEAHRPHAERPRRLIPLGALVLCVIAAALAGALHGGAVSAGPPPKKTPGPLQVQTKLVNQAVNRAARRQSACMPRYSAGHSEPWVGAKRKASQAAFNTNIAKESKYYVKGEHGWDFFGDKFDHNFSQALGRSTQSKGKEKAWAKYLQGAQAEATAAGADFHVVIAPANWDVYHQNLPAWAQKLRGSTSLEHLLNDYPNLPWIDTRAPLAKAGKQHATYQPLDSHWTDYGGWVAWQAITKCLRTDAGMESLREPAISGVGVGPNSNEFSSYGVPDGKPANTFPIYAEPRPATTITHIPDGVPVPVYPDGGVDQIYSPAQTVTPGAISPLSLLVLRDSTGNALSPLWDWTFAKTISYQHGVGQPGVAPSQFGSLVQQYHPNVVLLVMTERFLYYSPPKD